MNRPAFQFYPGDWQRDAALRSCSIGARGLWVEMICVMHQAEPYGHLVVNGKPVQPDTLARMVGCTSSECRRYLVELDGAGVFSREGEVIVSRRMVRDERIRRLRAEGGKRGGNPALKDKYKDDSKVNGKDNLPANLQPTPSSSVFSLQSSTSKPPGEEGGNANDVGRGVRLPHHYAPPTDRVEWAKLEKPGIDVDLATKKFKNHFKSLAGNAALRSDWDLAWENWILNEHGQSGGADKPINFDAVFKAARHD